MLRHVYFFHTAALRRLFPSCCTMLPFHMMCHVNLYNAAALCLLFPCCCAITFSTCCCAMAFFSTLLCYVHFPCCCAMTTFYALPRHVYLFLHCCKETWKKGDIPQQRGKSGHVDSMGKLVIAQQR